MHLKEQLIVGCINHLIAYEMIVLLHCPKGIFKS